MRVGASRQARCTASGSMKPRLSAGHFHHLHAALLQGAQGTGDGIVLHARSHHPVPRPQQSEQGLVDRLGGIGGEGDPRRIRNPEHAGHRLPCLKNQPPRRQSLPMAAPPGVGPETAQRPVDGSVDRLRFGKRGGGVIEVNSHGWQLREQADEKTPLSAFIWKLWLNRPRGRPEASGK